MEFEEIYKAYFGPVYRYLLRLSGSEQLAEELAAETFFRALRAADGFRGGCEVRVWLCQIAKNAYYTHQKKSRRARPADEALLGQVADPAPPPEEAADTRDRAVRLRAIAERLPEPYREVFRLRAFGELPYKDIGSLYGKTANWACVTFHRAREMIRRRWEEEEG